MATAQYQRLKYHRKRAQQSSRTRFQTPINPALYSEYLKAQQELSALLNVPKGFRLGGQFWRTVRYLESRLDDLEQRLSVRTI